MQKHHANVLSLCDCRIVGFCILLASDVFTVTARLNGWNSKAVAGIILIGKIVRLDILLKIALPVARGVIEENRTCFLFENGIG